MILVLSSHQEQYGAGPGIYSHLACIYPHVLEKVEIPGMNDHRQGTRTYASRTRAKGDLDILQEQGVNAQCIPHGFPIHEDSRC